MDEKQAAQFAARHVAPKLGLLQQEKFPDALWGKMAKAGLLGLGLPAEFGGGGADSATLVKAGAAFVRAGGNLGLAAAWFSHLAVARHIVHRFATAGQREATLPVLATGRMTASIAVSEPGAGAHPKHLAATAERTDEGWRLNGVKHYVTNGNIAKLIVVVAVSSLRHGRKEFSALLLPRDTPGLRILPMPPLDYLLPSQHVRLEMTECDLPAGALLGREGKAYDELARPFRDIEDIMNMGPLLGALEFQLHTLLDCLRGNKSRLGNKMLDSLGALDSRLTALRALAVHGAQVLDQDPEDGDLPRFNLAMRDIAAGIQKDLTTLGKSGPETISPAFPAMGHEVTSLLALPGATAQLKRRKIGAALLGAGA